jgi:hypothetical protein
VAGVFFSRELRLGGFVPGGFCVTLSIARSNRSHASGTVSMSSGLGFLGGSAMTEFYSAKLKIDRAKQHIADLRREFDAFVHANPYTRDIKFKHDPNEYSQMRDLRISIEFGKGIHAPEILGLLIGDAAHNLRSALDHLIWELIGPTGTKQDKHLSFPTGDTWTNYESTIDGLHTTPRGAKKFLKSFEAHRGGDGHALYGLHILDRTDKHRIINPIIAAAKISGLRDHRDGIVHPDAIAMISDDGEAVFPIHFRSIPRDDDPNFKTTLDVFFSNIDAFPF